MLFFRIVQIWGNPKTLTQSRQGAKVFLDENLPGCGTKTRFSLRRRVLALTLQH